MRFLRLLFDFYLDSSIHVALAVSALTMVTVLSFDLPYDVSVACFIFFSTIVTYNFIKYGSAAKYFFIVRSRYVRFIQFFSFACFGLLLLSMTRLRFETILVAGTFLVISFMYVIPFMFQGRNLRSLFGIKAYIVVFCWAGVTVVLPLVNDRVDLDNDVWVVFVQRLLYVMAILLPFEIRDLNFDSLHLGTIPQRIGIRRTKILGVGLMISFFFLTFLKETTPCAEIVQNLVLAIITGGFILMTKKEQSPYYCGFFVEGISLLWLLLVVAI